jgi:hypothetical protein
MKFFFIELYQSYRNQHHIKLKQLKVLVEIVPELGQKVRGKISGECLINILHHLIAIAKVGSINLYEQIGTLKLNYLLNNR